MTGTVDRELLIQEVTETLGRYRTANPWKPISKASLLLIPVHIRLALTLAVGAQAVGIAFSYAGLKGVSMPDSWLAKVAEADDVCAEGLSYLAECLAGAGRVTLADALHWMCIESGNPVAHAQPRATSSLGSGAKKLLSRARAQTTGATGQFERAALGISEHVTGWLKEAADRASSSLRRAADEIDDQCASLQAARKPRPTTPPGEANPSTHNDAAAAAERSSTTQDA